MVAIIKEVISEKRTGTWIQIEMNIRSQLKHTVERIMSQYMHEYESLTAATPLVYQPLVRAQNKGDEMDAFH